MVNALFLSVAALALLAACWQAVRAYRRPARVPAAILLIAGSGAVATLAPVAQQFESVVRPAFGRLVSNSLTLVAALGISLLVLTLSTTATPRLRAIWTRIGLLAGALVLLVGSFSAAHPPATRLGLFTGLLRAQPSLVVYLLTYTVYLAAVLVDIGIACARTIPLARGALRVGLVTLVCASIVGLLYAGDKVVIVAVELAGGPVAEPYCAQPFAGATCTFQVAFPAFTALLLVLGIVIPALGPRLATLLPRYRWAHAELGPLWTALTEQLPTVVLPPADSDPAGVRFLLYRRVIEIRDALLILDPWMPRHEPGDPQAEADAIVTALDRHARESTPPTDAPRRGDPATHNITDYRAEVRWLRQVARAFTRRKTIVNRPA